MIKNIIKKLLLCSFMLSYIATLTNCTTLYSGFHLDGWNNQNQNISKFMKKMYINFNGNTNFYFQKALKQQLLLSGIDIVDTKNNATSGFTLDSVVDNERPVTMIGAYNASENLINIVGTYRITNINKNTISKVYKSSASEIYTGNATQQLSTNSKKNVIIKKLYDKVATQIAYQILISKPIDYKIIPEVQLV